MLARLVAHRRVDYLARRQWLVVDFAGWQNRKVPGQDRNSSPCVFKERQTALWDPDRTD